MNEETRIVKRSFLKFIPPIYLQDSSVRNNLFMWFLIGLLIRISIMPFTVYFPDLLGVYWRSSLIAYRGMFWSGWTQAVIHYLHAFFLLIFRPLMPYFNDMFDVSTTTRQATWEMFIRFVRYPYVFRTLFLFKVPYLLFELGCVLILLWIFSNDAKKGLWTLKFWMVNPIVIFATYIAARFETVALFFMVLSLYYAKNNFRGRSLFSLGMSIIIRFYPLILLPFFIIILGRKLGERLKLAFWGLLPLGVMTIIGKSFHRPSELGMFMSKQRFSGYLLAMKFDLGYLKDYVFVFILVYTFLLLFTYYHTDHTFKNLWNSVLVLLLVFFATSFFHVHYLMWLIPFLTLLIVEDKRFMGLFVVQVLCFVVYTFHWMKNLAGWLFTPINPSFFMNLPEPAEHISQFYSFLKFIGIFRSIFSGVSLWIAYLVFRDFLLRRKEKKTALEA